MKLLLSIFVIVISTYNNSSAFVIEKRLPNFMIWSSEPDSTLTENEAVFELQLNTHYSDFDKSKQITYSCNGVVTKTKTDSLGKIIINVEPGDYKFKFYYDNKHFEVYSGNISIDKGHRSLGSVTFESSEMMIISDKPVIYVYPEESSNVNITMDLKGKFDFTYPKYDNGWSFTAKPNGTLDFNGNKHHYIFWDGQLKFNFNNETMKEGFVVAKNDLVPFFEKNLTKMGLNSNEKEDYITYWVPLMQKHDHCYIHFLFNEAYNEYANINISPKPDQLYRVYMIWNEVDNPETFDCTPQNIESFQRSGFSVVEWGGSYLNDQSIIQRLAN